ncbi:MAG: hypothetical protein OIF50_02370 [Flavobacteriaceae bacterium]|nr:hypothetical protein [Flavobacteriaceae bacterium]
MEKRRTCSNCHKDKQVSEFSNEHRKSNYCTDIGFKNWKANHPEKTMKQEKHKQIENTITQYVSMILLEEKKQHELSKWHKDNVRIQTHSEEFEYKDHPYSIFQGKQ